MSNHWTRVCAAAVLVALIAGPVFAQKQGLRKTRAPGNRKFESAFFDRDILVLPGVFWPSEAEREVLPLIRDHRALFEGKRVLEIGTGSGIISCYVAKCGAAKVVATDVSKVAVRSARSNSRLQQVDDVVEVRWVSPEDTTAYAVLEDDEKFDVILSNPPYSLVLDDSVAVNPRYAEHGDLGFSIIGGLEQRLQPDGVALLLYHSLFYQQIIVKLAEREGFEVRSHLSSKVTPTELNALFNHYARDLMTQRGLDPAEFRFDPDEVPWFRLQVEPKNEHQPGPLIEPGNPGVYPGFVCIRRKAAKSK